MSTETIAVICAGAGLVAIVAFIIWVRITARRDKEVFRQMEPIMEDLWNPLRFLADLRSVWPDLSDEQRAEIENSSTYRDGFHETRARALLDQLESLARRVRAVPHRRIRKAVLEFTREWESREPDSLKVILAMVRRRTTA